jgi:hypothetical protein
MQLRDHPLMSYRGIPSWPPVWTRIRGRQDEHPKGEVGTLLEVRWAAIELPLFNEFFLVIDYDRTVYMGCLLFDDAAFCLQVEHLLQDHCGQSIASVGSLDISRTF